MAKERHQDRRSDCPVNFAVESLGDKWSLLIIRDIIFWGKRTYGEFLKSAEGIATNILAARLEFLETEGIITKSPHPSDKRMDVYRVTERGVQLVPILIELVGWSAKHEGWHALAPKGTAKQRRLVERAVKTKNKFKAIEQFKEQVRKGGYIFQETAPSKNR